MIIAADYAASSISTQVSAFENRIYRWGPWGKRQCRDFRYRLGQGEDPNNTPKQNAVLDCERYTRALTCYLAFYGDSNTSAQAKADLAKSNQQTMDAECPEARRKALAAQ